MSEHSVIRFTTVPGGNIAVDGLLTGTADPEGVYMLNCGGYITSPSTDMASFHSPGEPVSLHLSQYRTRLFLLISPSLTNFKDLSP